MQEQRVLSLRQLPSVDALAQTCQERNGSQEAPRLLLLQAVREVLEQKRTQAWESWVKGLQAAASIQISSQATPRR